VVEVQKIGATQVPLPFFFFFCLTHIEDSSELCFSRYPVYSPHRHSPRKTPIYPKITAPADVIRQTGTVGKSRPATSQAIKARMC